MTRPTASIIVPVYNRPLDIQRLLQRLSRQARQDFEVVIVDDCSDTPVQDVVEGVNAYLRHLVAIGAILGGRCWADPDLNTPDQIAQGKVYFDFDFTPPFPAEHITFRSQLVNDYITEIF